MALDAKKVRRELVPRVLESDVFVIGQALASNTQRLSGLPYMSTDDIVSDTGDALDRFLEMFGYTIDPYYDDLKYVYCSDMVQSYPGPGLGRGGDREPTPREIENCAEWLDREIELMAPAVVVLVGKVAGKGFLQRYLKLRTPDMHNVWGKEYKLEKAGRLMSVFAIPHPASRIPRAAIYAQTGARIREILMELRS